MLQQPQDVLTHAIKFRLAVITGRAFLTLSLVALIGAWTIQVTKQPLFRLDQQHLLLDAIALATLGIGSLIDSLIHARHL